MRPIYHGHRLLLMTDEDLARHELSRGLSAVLQAVADDTTARFLSRGYAGLVEKYGPDPFSVMGGALRLLSCRGNTAEFTKARTFEFFDVVTDATRAKPKGDPALIALADEVGDVRLVRTFLRANFPHEHARVSDELIERALLACHDGRRGRPRKGEKRASKEAVFGDLWKALTGHRPSPEAVRKTRARKAAKTHRTP